MKQLRQGMKRSIAKTAADEWVAVCVVLQVCFYKLDGAPSGRVSISSCSENCEYKLATRTQDTEYRVQGTATNTRPGFCWSVQLVPLTLWSGMIKLTSHMSLTTNHHHHQPQLAGCTPHCTLHSVFAAVGVTFQDLKLQPIPLNLVPHTSPPMCRQHALIPPHHI